MHSKAMAFAVAILAQGGPGLSQRTAGTSLGSALCSLLPSLLEPFWGAELQGRLVAQGEGTLFEFPADLG